MTNSESRQAMREAFARRCLDWADFVECAGYPSGPLYVAIVRGVATDPEVIDLAIEAPRDQQVVPNLLLAAAHFLLMRGADHPLGRYYASVTSEPADPADPYPSFRDFCLAHRGPMADLLRSRATQTNEVRRALAVWPALCIAAKEAGRPLALLDIGTSAGLNLQLARFHYRYGHAREAGIPESPVDLSTEVRGPASPPLGPAPDIRFRLGIDARPLDVRDRDDTDWLRACVWPADHERRATLDAAVSLAREDPPDILATDAAIGLEQAASRVPGDLHLCIVHTVVFPYLGAAGREAVRRAVEAISRHRPVSWISFEAPGLAEHVPSPEPPAEIVARRGDTCLLGLTSCEGGSARPRTLAIAHPHVWWMEWLDPGTGTG